MLDRCWLLAFGTGWLLVGTPGCNGEEPGGPGAGGAGGAGTGGMVETGGSAGRSAGGNRMTGGTGGGFVCGAAAPCPSGEVCVEARISLGPTERTTYECVPNPCGSQTLDCSCAGNVCQDVNPSAQCVQASPTERMLRCVGGGVCASPDTLIATPEGNRPIAALRPGDLVYSSEGGALVAVPLLRTTRRAVVHHSVVQVRTLTGAVLELSAPHPTADGRTFGDLRVGDDLGGNPIVSRELLPYPYPYTYDILPASSSGTYLAHGVLIGSTLK